MTQPKVRRRGRPPADESPVSSEDILLAALRAFAARGYDGMSVRELTQQLGVSHNLIFQRFGRKEQLWTAVIDRFLGAMQDTINTIVDDAAQSEEPPEDTFRHVIITFIEANAARPELVRLMTFEASTASDRLNYLFDHFIVKSSTGMNRLYRRLVDQGLARPLPPATLFYLIAHGATAPAGHSALSHKLGVADPSDPATAHRHAVAVADILLNGFLLDPPLGASSEPSTTSERSTPQ